MTEWTYEHHIGMQRKRVGVIPTHRIDIRFYHPDHFLAHEASVHRS